MVFNDIKSQYCSKDALIGMFKASMYEEARKNAYGKFFSNWRYIQPNLGGISCDGSDESCIEFGRALILSYNVPSYLSVDMMVYIYRHEIKRDYKAWIEYMDESEEAQNADQ